MLGDFSFSTTYLDKQEVEYQATSDGVVDEVWGVILFDKATNTASWFSKLAGHY